MTDLSLKMEPERNAERDLIPLIHSMTDLSRTVQTLEPNGNPNQELGRNAKISVYEQSREERIRENLERMRSLGILDLSLKLKSHSRSTKRGVGIRHSARKPTRDSPLASSSYSLRRSSRVLLRLQNATPASYPEVVAAKKDKRNKEGVELEEGSRWGTQNGKRIYDPVHGKTCHQCRQKTLGYRTQCSQCNMIQGQFCGGCLYTRYGEHVLEALENENWVCPVCRGICNCSICRNAKGLLPTGPIYRKISKLGYKSVAHYLIQTRQLEEPQKPSDDLLTTPKLMDKDGGEVENGGGCQSEKDNVMEENLNSARRSLLISHSENNSEDSGLALVIQEMNLDNVTVSESSREHGKKRKHFIEPNRDSIGARLRQRRSNINLNNCRSKSQKSC